MWRVCEFCWGFHITASSELENEKLKQPQLTHMQTLRIHIHTHLIIFFILFFFMVEAFEVVIFTKNYLWLENINR